ncbi:type IV secretory system conjugative DNA transfer family protein [Trueperella pyogenes]|uniref:type IV secretory system conjugative DNA transfer family protein n=1 Tax=Trueperella pyogenes TaxID=1661 RepID=UPI00345D5168
MKTMDPSDRAMLIGALLLIGVLGMIDVAVHVGLAFTGQSATWNPFRLIIGLSTGQITMSDKGWIITGVVVGVIVLVIVIATMYRAVVTSPRVRGDERGRLTGAKAASGEVRTKAVEDKARQFGIDNVKTHGGFPLGRAIPDGGIIRGDWESVGTLLAGPRTGKTVAFAIPWVISGPGAVLATSNKRDLVDSTALVRSQRTGQKVWIFDPTKIRKHDAQCWWNPLTYLTSNGFDGSVVSRSRILSSALGDAGRAAGGQNSRYDGFWDGGGDQIRAALLAAAALGGHTMQEVHTWASLEVDETPVEILTAHGLDAVAASLRGMMNLPPDTKGGMWASARMGLSWIEDPDMDQWYMPGSSRDEFDPVSFVRSRETLYSMSKDTSDVTPLVSALTIVTCMAAEAYAESQGGRMPTPMMVVLDEAANVCPWRDLPKLYSHFGSKGICLQTILQSWSQGADVWGETGMKKLWSASNTAIYAGGIKETGALDSISKLLGTYYEDQISYSSGSGSRSRSVTKQARERPIATVDELASLPQWRAWLFASKSRPVLMELEPWFRSADKDDIQQSLASYGG